MEETKKSKSWMKATTNPIIPSPREHVFKIHERQLRSPSRRCPNRRLGKLRSVNADAV